MCNFFRSAPVTGHAAPNRLTSAKCHKLTNAAQPNSGSQKGGDSVSLCSHFGRCQKVVERVGRVANLIDCYIGEVEQAEGLAGRGRIRTLAGPSNVDSMDGNGHQLTQSRWPCDTGITASTRTGTKCASTVATVVASIRER